MKANLEISQQLTHEKYQYLQQTYITLTVFFVKELMFMLCVVLQVIWHKYVLTSLLFIVPLYYKLIKCLNAVDIMRILIDAGGC